MSGVIDQQEDHATGSCGPLIVAGVSGSGKSTVSRLVAAEWGWAVLDPDRLHSAEAIEKMRGCPVSGKVTIGCPPPC